MKTNQNLIRKMGDFDVVQRTKDGMFNATELMKQWNKHSGQQKNIGQYFAQSSTTEFISALCKENGIDCDGFVKGRDSAKNSLSGIYVKSRGIQGGTWMEPLLFIDYAMWLNPAFKVKVLKFVYDELIKYRNDAGDAYREMAGAVAKIAPNDQVPQSIQKVAKAVNYIVYNEHDTEIRNKRADESKLHELSELERDIAKLINDRFIKSFDALIEYLRRKWYNKYVPTIMNN